MFHFITPRTLFRTQIHTLRSNLPGVLDGLAVSIHDARIATRRIRELLPLLRDRTGTGADDLLARFRRLGRSLGRVRDADVRVTLLTLLETRIPRAAPALVVLRQRRERERLKLLRKLIKRLERLDAIRLIESLDDRSAHWPARGARVGGVWRRDLRRTLSQRAEASQEAIEHATGVYFPDRAHAARIAIKKLRYAVEIAHETRNGDRTHAIRELKKVQDLLGDLHDRQELIDSLTVQADDGQRETDERVALVQQVLEAECHHLHSRYLARRECLLTICQAERLAPRKPIFGGHSLVTAGAVAVSSGMLVMHRLHTGHRNAD